MRPGPSRVSVMVGFTMLCLVWGSSYLAIRVAIETLPPFVMAGVRWVVAGLVLYGLARLRGDARPTAREWRNALFVGALLFLGSQGSTVWAESRIPSGLTAVLAATFPLWVLVVTWVRPRGHSPGRRLGTGMFLGLGGVVLLAAPWQTGSGHLDLVGFLVAALAPVAMALGSIYLHESPRAASLLVRAASQMLCGGALLCLLGAVTGEWGHPIIGGHLSLASALAFLFLTIFGSLVGYSLLCWLLSVRSPAFVATYGYINPVIALALGWALAQERLTARTLLASIIIVVAVALVTSGRNAAEKERRKSDDSPESAPPGGQLARLIGDRVTLP